MSGPFASVANGPERALIVDGANDEGDEGDKGASTDRGGSGARASLDAGFCEGGFVNEALECGGAISIP